MIGLDGCLLKGQYRGQLLAIVGQDGNNSFYLIAIVVVHTECKYTWSWFLKNLLKDVRVDVIACLWSFITDR